jgi:hypothetical protein
LKAIDRPIRGVKPALDWPQMAFIAEHEPSIDLPNGHGVSGFWV